MSLDSGNKSGHMIYLNKSISTTVWKYWRISCKNGLGMMTIIHSKCIMYIVFLSFLKKHRIHRSIHEVIMMLQVVAEQCPVNITAGSDNQYWLSFHTYNWWKSMGCANFVLIISVLRFRETRTHVRPYTVCQDKQCESKNFFYI